MLKASPSELRSNGPRNLAINQGSGEGVLGWESLWRPVATDRGKEHTGRSEDPIRAPECAGEWPLLWPYN